MNVKIIEDNKQPLFGRRLVKAEIDFGQGHTPARTAVRDHVAKAIKAEAKLVAVRRIDTAYGFRKADVEAYVYGSEADLAKLEPKHIVKRHEPKAKKGEAAEGQ